MLNIEINTFSPSKLSRALYYISRLGTFNLGTDTRNYRKDIVLSYYDQQVWFKSVPVLAVKGAFRSGNHSATLNGFLKSLKALKLEKGDSDLLDQAIERMDGLILLEELTAYKLIGLLQWTNIVIDDPEVSIEQRAIELNDRNTQTAISFADAVKMVSNQVVTFSRVDPEVTSLEHKQAKRVLELLARCGDVTITHSADTDETTFTYQGGYTYKVSELMSLGINI